MEFMPGRLKNIPEMSHLSKFSQFILSHACRLIDFFDPDPDIGNAFQPGRPHAMFELDGIGSGFRKKNVSAKDSLVVVDSRKTASHPFSGGFGKHHLDSIGHSFSPWG
jgi:hypothetical protein